MIVYILRKLKQEEKEEKSNMNERKIIVRPFEMISVLQYTGNQQVGGHGTVKIAGIIKKEKKEEYITKAGKETQVQIVTLNEDESEVPVFSGILDMLEIHSEGDVCRMDLVVCTGSKLMDYKHHTRSFQKSSYTYKEVVNCCNRNYSNAGVIMTAGKEECLPDFVMQYGETDWEFLKRMAGVMNTILVASCKVEGAKYFFGLPEKHSKETLDTDSYTMRSEKVRINEKASDSIHHRITYIVESRKVLELGDIVPFLGKEQWIWKIETILRGNELFHTYYLRDRSGMKGFKRYNQSLIGLSLLGEITAVEGEQVKIKLKADENTECGSRWFRFSTVYSSADGAGWYCMPEPGDMIRLYFPTEMESEAYVSSAFHENQGDGIRVNPDHKIWRTKEGKEIRLTPERILITNNKGMSVELSDQKGITINSNKSIDITAEQNIDISSSGANLELDASNKILLKQGDTIMEMADGIRLSGGKINMQ